MIMSKQNDPQYFGINISCLDDQIIGTNQQQFIYIIDKLPLTKFSKSRSENFNENIVRGRILISPILLSWFLFFSEDYSRISPIFSGQILILSTFLFRSSCIASAKTAEKLEGLLQNHSIYLDATKLRLYTPSPSISP